MSEVSASAPAAPATTNAPSVAAGGQAAAKESYPRSDGDDGSPAVRSPAAAEPSPGGEVAPEVSVPASTQQVSAVSQSAAETAPPEISAEGEGSASSAPVDPPATEAGASSTVSDGAPVEPQPFAPPPEPISEAGYLDYVRAYLKDPELQFESAVRKWWSAGKKLRASYPNMTQEIVNDAQALVSAHINAINAVG